MHPATLEDGRLNGLHAAEHCKRPGESDSTTSRCGRGTAETVALGRSANARAAITSASARAGGEDDRALRSGGVVWKD